MKKLTLLLVVLLMCFGTNAAPTTAPSSLPTLYIIGDSTVHNHDNLVGWGDVIGESFDTSKIKIENHAMGGRSSRTFLNEGRWDEVMKTLKPGDFVLIQFGHNDESPVNDATRARGTLPGLGDETKEIDNGVTKKHETVHTFGWYMRKYIDDAKSKGATPIVCSPVPRERWEDGKIVRTPQAHAGWAKQLAEQEHIPFIDLNDAIATKYEQMGPDKVHAFFPSDHTHVNRDGAKLAADTVVEGIRLIKDGKLAEYLK
jgi:rhamnogalacturonan acetylesterase